MSVLRDLEPLARDHRLIFYDQRGGGRSDLPNDTSLLDAKYFVEDLEAVRRFFKLDRVALLAHSFGPVVAARYAEAHSGRIERLIFLGAVGPRLSDAGAFAAEVARRLPTKVLERMKEVVTLLQSDQNVDRVALCREYEELARAAIPQGVAPPLSMCGMRPEALDYSFRNTSRIVFESFGNWNFTTSLRRLSGPLLVIYGDKDPSPVAAQHAWVNSVKDGRLMILAGAGHNLHRDQPKLVFEAITTFMKGAWPAGAVRP